MTDGLGGRDDDNQRPARDHRRRQNPFPVENMPQAGRSLMFNLVYTQELTTARN